MRAGRWCCPAPPSVRQRGRAVNRFSRCSTHPGLISCDARNLVMAHPRHCLHPLCRLLLRQQVHLHPCVTHLDRSKGNLVSTHTKVNSSMYLHSNKQEKKLADLVVNLNLCSFIGGQLCAVGRTTSCVRRVSASLRNLCAMATTTVTTGAMKLIVVRA